ncbi:TetR/AcrR family transcriptional regulator [Streptacidiphilus sp. N1-3]|uniref:TetR/AcrR family transcriptional regulator n=1 Tax=Streptacidiphilus alkalitolerans TaxID=3342712 RepID=A0ABV6WVP9_9ACTN
MAMASVEGLEGLSLARLALTLGVSKSGLFTHWPDKQHLQLAIVEHATRQWTELIVAPALARPRGVRRLWALHEQRLGFYEAETLPGGCFFAAVQHEFDDWPGPVHDAIAQALVDWLALLRQVAVQAGELGELRPETDPEQLAFEINALGEAVVTHLRLMPGGSHGLLHSRRAVLDRLRALSTDPSLLPSLSSLSNLTETENAS